jgi:polysaccharide pyruvyl transferase WcaK-like protein
MYNLRVHIVHVGSARNKGAQALLKSDISIIKDLLGSDAVISVSAVDPEEIRLMFPVVNEVVCPLVDIPHDKADMIARKFGYKRNGLRYKAAVVSNLVWMPVQIALCVLSSVLAKARIGPLYRSAAIDQIRKSQLVVSCSDENFKEGASFLSLNVYWIPVWWSMIISRLFDVLVSRYFGKRVVMFPNSVGPFHTLIGRALSGLALRNCNYLLIRDPVSYKIVDSLNIATPRVLTYDMALLYRSSSDKVTSRTDTTSAGKPMICVCLGFYSHVVSEKKMHRMINEYAIVLDNIIEKYDARILFLPHYVSGFRFDDLEVSQLIHDKMKHKNMASVLNLFSVAELSSVLQRAEMVITSKMHPAVLATSSFVPTVCIAYDLKQVGYFQQLDMMKCVMSVNESPLKLQNQIEYVWSNRAGIRASLEKKIPIMQANVRRAVKRALGLVK